MYFGHSGCSDPPDGFIKKEREKPPWVVCNGLQGLQWFRNVQKAATPSPELNQHFLKSEIATVHDFRAIFRSTGGRWFGSTCRCRFGVLVRGPPKATQCHLRHGSVNPAILSTMWSVYSCWIDNPPQGTGIPPLPCAQAPPLLNASPGAHMARLPWNSSLPDGGASHEERGAL